MCGPPQWTRRTLRPETSRVRPSPRGESRPALGGHATSRGETRTTADASHAFDQYVHHSPSEGYTLRDIHAFFSPAPPPHTPARNTCTRSKSSIYIYILVGNKRSIRTIIELNRPTDSGTLGVMQTSTLGAAQSCHGVRTPAVAIDQLVNVAVAQLRRGEVSAEGVPTVENVLFQAHTLLALG